MTTPSDQPPPPDATRPADNSGAETEQRRTAPSSLSSGARVGGCAAAFLVLAIGATAIGFIVRAAGVSDIALIGFISVTSAIMLTPLLLAAIVWAGGILTVVRAARRRKELQ